LQGTLKRGRPKKKRGRILKRFPPRVDNSEGVNGEAKYLEEDRAAYKKHDRREPSKEERVIERDSGRGTQKGFRTSSASMEGGPRSAAYIQGRSIHVKEHVSAFRQK